MIKALAGFALFAMLLASVYSASYAQSTISLSLDKRAYTKGESVTIFGVVQPAGNIPVLLQVWSPDNEACNFQRLNAREDGSFASMPVVLSGNTCGKAGTYTVKAFYGDLQGSTTFQLQLSAEKPGNGRLQALLEVLANAKKSIDEKIAALQGKGITIPDRILKLYDEGLKEYDLAKRAVEAQDTASAKDHIRKAMKAFKKVSADLSSLEAREGKSSDRSGEDKARDVNKLKEAISRTEQFRNKLAGIAASSGITDLDARFAEADKALRDALAFAEAGDIDSAAKSLASAKKILDDVQKSITTKSKESEKAKKFATQTIERIDRMIAEAEALNAPQELVDQLKAIQQKLQNAETVREVDEISKELRGIHKQISALKGTNFEEALRHMQAKLDGSKTRAGSMGLELQAYTRIQELIDKAASEWQAGMVQQAVGTLQKAGDMLAGIDSILGDIGEKINSIDRLRGVAEQLGEEYADDRAAQDTIQKAVALLDDAERTLQGATSRKDLKAVDTILGQAKRTLESVESKPQRKEGPDSGKMEKFAAELEHKAQRLKNAAEEKNNREAAALADQALDLIAKARQSMAEGNNDDAATSLQSARDVLGKAEAMLKAEQGEPPKKINADAISKEIRMLENMASELKSKAGDNTEALAEIDAALNDLQEAKRLLADNEPEKALQKVGTAKEHLRKARQLIEQSEHDEHEERERENTRKN